MRLFYKIHTEFYKIQLVPFSTSPTEKYFIKYYTVCKSPILISFLFDCLMSNYYAGLICQ